MKKNIILTICIFFLGINFVYAKDTAKYLSCVDGDTIKVTLKGKKVTVRLLAIDTPETAKQNKAAAYYGEEASKYTCNKIKKAKKIQLEYDKNSDKFDKYNRLLAWVFVDDKLLQETLITKGYAQVAYLYGNYKYTETLKEKQELASAKGIGIWNEADKANYEKKLTTNVSSVTDEYTNKEIIIIVILFLIIVFISDKAIKNKAKKKLKKYL